MQTRMKTKKTPANPTPYPFIYHFSRKKVPLSYTFYQMYFINAQCFFYIEINLKNSLYTDVFFIFLSVPTPLHWRSINPLQFIFYHPRSADFEEGIEGL